MKIYICDKCNHSVDSADKIEFYSEEIPFRWIHINMSYYNRDDISGTRRLIQGGGEKHFCSKECFINYFFFTDEEIIEREKKNNPCK